MQTSPRRPSLIDRLRRPCVAYLLCTISRNLLPTGPNSSPSLRSSAIVVLTGPAVTLVSEPYWYMSVLRSLVSVRIFLKQIVASDKRIRRTDTGAQPLVSEDGKVVLAVNGEIYNHVKLRAACGSTYKFKTHSDCEVIIPLVRGVCADTASPIISCCAQVS